MSKNKVGVKRRCSWNTLKKPLCLEKMCLLNRLATIMSSLPLRREWGTDWQVEKQGGMEGREAQITSVFVKPRRYWGATQEERTSGIREWKGAMGDRMDKGKKSAGKKRCRSGAAHPKCCLHFYTCRQLFRAVYSCCSNSFLYRFFFKGADITVRSSWQSILNFIAVF